MNSITIELKAAELAQALNNLAAALSGGSAALPAQSITVPMPAVAGITAPEPMPAPTTAPAAPASVPGNVPVAPLAAPPSFTVEQVGTAGAELLREHPEKLQDLQALLQQFGVPAVHMLKPEQIGQFATALRGLGAKI